MVVLDVLDRRIIDALRVNPRASWTLVGRVLSLDPVTAARRWGRLRSTGQAWVGAYPGRSALGAFPAAFLEVDCEPGAGGRVANMLALDPRVLNVMQTAGGRDIILTVTTAGMGELTRYLDGAFDRVPGIRSVRSAVITSFMQEGSAWRGGSLTAGQEDALRATPSERVAPTIEPMEPIDYRMLTVLGEDGRMSLGELANRTDSSVSTVRRRLPQLLSSGAITLRTDLARGLSEFPYVAEFFIQTPASSLGEVHRQISQLPEVRSSAAVAAPDNLRVSAWLKTQSDVSHFEEILSRTRLPMRIRDRSLVLRWVKHIGRILDDDGNSISYIPMQYRLTN